MSYLLVQFVTRYADKAVASAMAEQGEDIIEKTDEQPKTLPERKAHLIAKWHGADAADD